MISPLQGGEGTRRQQVHLPLTLKKGTFPSRITIIFRMHINYQDHIYDMLIIACVSLIAKLFTVNASFATLLITCIPYICFSNVRTESQLTLPIYISTEAGRIHRGHSI